MIALYLPYILFGMAGAGVIALIGAWMAYSDLVEEATICNVSPSANATSNNKWWNWQDSADGVATTPMTRAGRQPGIPI